MNMLKKALIASAVSAAALLAASAASAQVNYNVTTVGFSGESLTWTGAPAGAHDPNGGLAGLITLTTSNHGIVPTFCVDLFNTISLGNAYTYTASPLAYDSSSGLPGLGGIPLTSTQIGEIGRLADIGAQLYASGTGTQDQYAALQGAIWQFEYPGFTVTGGLTDPSLLTTYSNEASTNPLTAGVWSIIPGVNGQNPYLGVTYSGQALVTAPGPKMGEGLLGFFAMTALLIGVRYRGLFV